MQAGLVIKDYFVVDTIAGMSSSASVQSTPVPKAGIGINIVLNRSFSLKVSYDISSGSKIKDPYNREKVETVWDDNTSVGPKNLRAICKVLKINKIFSDLVKSNIFQFNFHSFADRIRMFILQN